VDPFRSEYLVEGRGGGWEGQKGAVRPTNY